MGLVLYHDEACTIPVDGDNPDIIDRAILENNNLADVKKFWIKSDNIELTYRNVEIDGYGDKDNAQSGEVDVQYATDNNGSPGAFVQTLTLPDGQFIPAVPIWRRIYSPSLQNALRISTIRTLILAHDYKV